MKDIYMSLNDDEFSDPKDVCDSWNTKTMDATYVIKRYDRKIMYQKDPKIRMQIIGTIYMEGFSDGANTILNSKFCRSNKEIIRLKRKAKKI